MQIKNLYLIIILLGLFTEEAAAQKGKKVVVFGDGPAAVGAAVQAAHSGVQTLLVSSSPQLLGSFSLPDSAGAIGLDADLIAMYKAAGRNKNGGADPPSLQSFIKGWTDTVKNLSVVRNVTLDKIEKSRSKWKVRLSDGSRLSPEIVVDGTDDRSAAIKAGAEKAGGTFRTVVPFHPVQASQLYSNNLYRTFAAASSNDLACLPIGALISFNQENLIFAAGAGQVQKGSLAAGQSAGASAAYCAFFNKTTKSINIRAVQGELLAFRAELIPLSDISPRDSNFSEIQHIIATGIIKAVPINNGLQFLPDSSVTVNELREPVKAYFSRSQIWFQNKKDSKLTLNDALSLIKFTGTRGEELNREVERSWKTTFKFKSPYNLNNPVTRREFAVLMDTYLKPFNVRVGSDGKLLY